MGQSTDEMGFVCLPSGVRRQVLPAGWVQLETGLHGSEYIGHRYCCQSITSWSEMLGEYKQEGVTQVKGDKTYGNGEKCFSKQFQNFHKCHLKH